MNKEYLQLEDYIVGGIEANEYTDLENEICKTWAVHGGNPIAPETIKFDLSDGESVSALKKFFELNEDDGKVPMLF